MQGFSFSAFILIVVARQPIEAALPIMGNLVTLTATTMVTHTQAPHNNGTHTIHRTPSLHRVNHKIVFSASF
jgi:hypothetical protein